MNRAERIKVAKSELYKHGNKRENPCHWNVELGNGACDCHRFQ